LLAAATFGVGFFMRPIGGVLLGILADRKGRKAALLVIIALMTVAIALIGFAPTYAAIGVAAPLTIVVARLLQGFATGGEFATPPPFSLKAPRRGVGATTDPGKWSDSALPRSSARCWGALVTRLLTPEALDGWGWRVPFWFGLAIAPVGLFIRSYVEETEPFLASRRATSAPPAIGAALLAHYRGALVSMGLVVAGTIQFYVILLYMPTFASTELHLSLGHVFLAQTVGLACMIVVIPLAGALSDHVGRKPMLVAATGLCLCLTYPLFSWVDQEPSLRNLMIMQVTLCSVLAISFGPFSTAMAEQFSALVRSTAIGVAYNVAVMVFGGFAQFFVTWLIKATRLADRAGVLRHVRHCVRLGGRAIVEGSHARGRAIRPGAS
jgi:MFS family permease